MKTPALILSLLIGCSLSLFAADPVVPDVLPLGAFQSVSSWRFSNGAEFAGAKGSLNSQATSTGQESSVTFDFSAGGAYVAAFTAITVSEDYSEIRLRVKSAQNLKLSFRLNDSTGQCHQIPVSYDRAGEWQTIRYDLKTHRPGQRWGGPADGVLHFPLTSFSLVVPNPKTDTPTGVLLFSDAKALR